MTNLEQNIVEVIKQSPLKEKISYVSIFGSYAKEEQNENSDIDLLIDFTEPVGFQLLRLEKKLEEKIGRKIDLLTPDAISPYLISEVQQSKKIIYER